MPPVITEKQAELVMRDVKRILERGSRWVKVMPPRRDGDVILETGTVHGNGQEETRTSSTHYAPDGTVTVFAHP